MLQSAHGGGLRLSKVAWLHAQTALDGRHGGPIDDCDAASQGRVKIVTILVCRKDEQVVFGWFGAVLAHECVARSTMLT